MDLQSMVKEVKKYGFYKIPSFLSKEQVANLNTEFDSVFDKLSDGDQLEYPNNIEKDGYGFGKILRIPRSHHSNLQNLSKYVDTDWFGPFTDKYYGKCNNKKLQTFCTHDYIPQNKCKNSPRNSFLHIDPYQAIKFLSFLTDTKKENGAFRCIPETAYIGEKIRSSYNLKELLNSDKYCFNEANKFYDSKIVEQAIYLEAQAGDLFIINTDIIHGGGIIEKEGLSRRTLNLHNREN